MNPLRKLVAVLAVLAVLCLALAPASTGLPWAILVPILLLTGLLAVVPADRRPEQRTAPIFQFSPVVASRAPPSL